MISARQSAALNPLGVDLDHFLYASVGEDHQCERLTVVSALARAGVDPWDEAALLSRLPFNDAVHALGALLARLPAGSGKQVDPILLATHLVSLLPRRPRWPTPQTVTAAASTGTGPSPHLIPLICAVYLLLLLASQLLIQHQAAAETAPAVTPALHSTVAAPSDEH